tara:strand:+ start:429 stop:635 length:207 start_codon:yes stop_codon:yes gene_type:complete
MYGKFLSTLMIVIGALVLLSACYFTGKVPGMEGYTVYSQNPVEILSIGILGAIMIVLGFYGVNKKHHC